MNEYKIKTEDSGIFCLLAILFIAIMIAGVAVKISNLIKTEPINNVYIGTTKLNDEDIDFIRNNICQKLKSTEIIIENEPYKLDYSFNCAEDDRLCSFLESRDGQVPIN